MDATSKSDYDSTFAKKLRDLIEAKSVSMTALAKELGVKQQTVSQWADGSTTPALKHLKPLASYFDVSIDELVTGVATDNEELHIDTGLSNLAIEILKQLSADGADDGVSGDSKVIIEFLNVMIESMNSECYSLSRLARLCMDYIVGAHKPILEQEKLAALEAEGGEVFVHTDRPNYRNDVLDFRTYRLTKDFEYFIEHLTKSLKTAARAKKIYVEGNLNLPDYSDSRFKPGAIFGDMGKYPIGFGHNEPDSGLD